MTQPGGEPSGAANSGGATQVPMFTQEQVNHFTAEAKRGAVGTFFKEQVGLEAPLAPETLKETLTKATEYDKLQQGQKTELQQANDQVAKLTTTAERVPVLETTILQQKIAADEGLKSRYWKFVEGKTEDEIKASVKEILADFGPKTPEEGDEGGKAPEGQQGGGKRPDPNEQQGTGGSGGAPKATMSKGQDAYAARHGKK